MESKCCVFTDIRQNNSSYVKIIDNNDEIIEYEFEIDHYEHNRLKRCLNLFLSKRILFYLNIVFSKDDLTNITDYFKKILTNFEVYNVIYNNCDGFVMSFSNFPYFDFPLNEKIEYVKNGSIHKSVILTGRKK